MSGRRKNSAFPNGLIKDLVQFSLRADVQRISSKIKAMAFYINCQAHFSLLILLLVIIGHAFTATVYVKENGKGDGSSWAVAYGNLQSALNIAQSGDQIWVAAGTYKPTSAYDLNLPGNRDLHFRMKNNVRIYGGFPSSGSPGWADRDPDLYVTILSGDIGTTGNNSDNCYHVFYHPEFIILGTTAALDGFTITGGNADGVDWPHYTGGGMYNEYASPSVINCSFTDNTALYGGGMHNYFSNPTIADCTFSNNMATGNPADVPAGGGMANEFCNPSVTSCIFSGNVADYGGGMDNYYSHPLVSNCFFTGNSALYGGGMDNLSGSPFVTDCTFSNNTAEGDPNSAGGGMSNFLEDGSSLISSPTVIHCIFSGNSAVYGGGIENEYRNPTVADCTFSGNIAVDSGGGMYNLFSNPDVTACIFNGNTALYGGGISNEDSNSLIVNCAFGGNIASSYGGAIENFDNSNSTVTNCSFTGNTADYGGAMKNDLSDPDVNNSIFWNNTAVTDGHEIYNDTSNPVIAYSDIAACGASGPNWDTSLGTDAGGNIDADPLFLADIPGQLRLLSSSPCIDAGDNNAVPTGITTDLNGVLRFIEDPTVIDTGNGTAPIVDMGAFESDDSCLGRDKADFDCNGIVDMADLVYLAFYWLQ